jgi:tRNA modification GTPase
MWLKKHDTIVAIATPPGPGGVGVVRVSGGLVLDLAANILKKQDFVHRQAIYSDFLGDNGEILDRGLAIFFKAPNSFTGEDVLELQAHGSPVVLDLLLRRIINLGGRLAEPGEFSKRAFLSGKMDLVQAESVLSLIHAQTEQAARASVRSLRGDFSNRINILQQELINLRMQIEGSIDFPEDVEEVADRKRFHTDLNTIKSRVSLTLQQAKQGSIISSGVNAVILGGPNVGKSSLLNLLAGDDVAIVTDIPGTTRDILTQKINIDGLLIHFSDTAGIRETSDLVESIGVQRAKDRAKFSDLVLHLVSANDFELSNNSLLQIFDGDIYKNLTNTPKILIVNKIDLASSSEPKIIVKNNVSIVWVSVKEQLGIDLLLSQIKKTVGFEEQSEVFTARTRHIVALQQALEYIDNGLNLSGPQSTDHIIDLLAEELRLAQQELSKITGEFSSEDLLGKIFAEFCIGK